MIFSMTLTVTLIVTLSVALTVTLAMNATIKLGVTFRVRNYRRSVGPNPTTLRSGKYFEVVDPVVLEHNIIEIPHVIYCKDLQLSERTYNL